MARAAEHGEPGAARDVYDRLRNGENVAVDERQIASALQKRVDAGDAEAMRSLGVRRAVLWVLDANSTARRFYERQGWVWDGARVERSLGGFAGFPTVIEVRYTLDLV